MNEILISGYYGFKNSGDDALLLSIIKDLKSINPELDLVVLSKNPEETKRIYGVKAISRFNPFAIAAHMRRARLLISGGGTLLQDGTSSKSLWYYLAVIRTAKLMGVKVMIYSNGIGPLTRACNRRAAKRTLEKADLITLRDANALAELKGLGVENKNTVLTADPAFNLEGADRERGERLLREQGADTNKKILGISVRSWKRLPPDFADSLAQIADYAAERYDLYTVFLPMQPSRDTALSERIMNKLKTPATIMSGGETVEDMLSVVSCMEVCIGMRLHTLIYASANSVPLIGLVYDPKINGFMDYIGQKSYIDVERVTFERLKDSLDYTMEHYSEIKGRLQPRLAELKEKAALNAKYAVELYERGAVDIE